MDNTFSKEKNRLIKILGKLLEKFSEIENKFNVDLNELKSKIKVATTNIEQEKFSIAFFGAFSDGKSTILSALTNRLDIKISPEPTTDRIDAYTYGDYLIIDTPGLFSEHQMHDELTKKYISEANVVIYTVSPTNPLKESHAPTIKWLLKDLDKLDSTIFVINKMDEVADITDDEDFDKMCRIKREVVKNTLNSYLDNQVEPKIICVAANPGGKGLEYWLKGENLDIYQKYSRINKLKDSMEEFINKSKDTLVNKAGISVIKDSISQLQSQLNDLLEKLEKAKMITNSQIEELQRRLSLLDKEISQQYINIKEELLRYRESLVVKIQTCANINELRNFYLTEIGEEAHIINEKIDLIIKKYLINIDEMAENIERQIEQSVNFHDELDSKLLSSLSKVGAKFGEKILSMSNKKIMSKLFELRRNSKILRDLIKFKSGGQAMQWASKWVVRIKGFGKAMKALPIVTETLDILLKIWNEKRFKREKSDITNMISNLFREFLEDFTEDSFKSDYFPFLNNIRDMIEELEYKEKETLDLISVTKLYSQEIAEIAKAK